MRRATREGETGSYPASGVLCPLFAPRATFLSFLFSCSPIFSSAVQVHVCIVSSSPHLSCMHPKYRRKSEKRFTVSDHRFKRADNMRSHMLVGHCKKVFTCSQLKCEFASSGKTSLAQHSKGLQGTATSLVCDHPGCTYRSSLRGNISRHERQAHSEERPFSCSHTGCSFRSKTNDQLMSHQRHVHLKIRTKCCHVCDKRFFQKSNLRDHMKSHQSNDHDMSKCDHCVTFLNICSTRSKAQAQAARRAERKITKSTANKGGIEYYMKKAGRKEKTSISFGEIEVGCETTDRLNEDLLEMHMDMQLLSTV